MEIEKHIEEPLFSIAVAGFLIVLVRSWLGKGIIADGLFMLLGLLGILSAYFTYLYLKSGKQKRNILIPMLFIATMYFSYLADQSGSFTRRDFTVFAITAAAALATTALYLHKLIKPTKAVLLPILVMSLMIHLAPAADVEGVAWHGKYLGGIDPYFHYRLATYIVTDGFVPESEPLVYAPDPPDFHRMTLMGAAFMGALGALLKPFGVSIMDIAMLYPGIIGGLAIIPFYLLIKELFTEFRQHNKIAALFGAFMLALSPSFAINASATMCEDDALGAFFFILTSMFFVMAIKRKSLKHAIAAGFSAAILALTWGAFEYIILTLGAFTCIATVLKFLNKENCMEYAPYFAITVIATQISPLIIHQQGVFDMSIGTWLRNNWIFVATAAGTLTLTTLLEALRLRLYGKIRIGKKHEDFQAHIYAIAAILAIVGVIILLALNPVTLFSQITGMLGVKPTDIIAQTTAEQSATCGDVFSKECVDSLRDRFGVAALIGLILTPILAYWGLTRKSVGALFILIWSLPIVWGVTGKTAYLFMGSIPITALGATVGLLVPLSIKEANSPLRTITTLTLLSLITVSSLSSPLLVIDAFGGSKAMYYGSIGDRIYWEPALQWMKNNVKADEIIVTWWDYGHWIASEAGKRSLLDNTKARPMMVQDIAKLHVIIDNETDAVNMMKKYDAQYWVVDYTMIQKSGAPYYIATSDIENRTPGKSMSYLPCTFQPSYSDLTGSVENTGDGTYAMTKSVVFVCSDIGLVFEVVEDRISNAYVLTAKGNKIQWKNWQADTGASILGLQSIRPVIGNALNYGTDNFADFPTFTQLIYVPKELNKVVMTSTYLGEYQDEYKALGLASQDVQKLDSFKLVDGFKGDKEDYSYFGYVRVYEVSNGTSV